MNQTARLPQHYTDLSLIAEGGMGAVYRARDSRLNKTVAIKVLRMGVVSERELKRFQTEAKALSKLNHPNIIAVQSFGQTSDAQPYMVLEYVEGISLSQHLKVHGKMGSLAALPLFQQLCDGLDHAHANGIIHRDIKPSNVLVSQSYDGPVYHLADFGIARFAAGVTQNLTQSGSLIGTPAYACPEQCVGGKTDARSDIYSLGCLMFEVLSGRPPFVSDSILELLTKHCNEEPPAIKDVAADTDVSTGMERIVNRCLAKDPADRFQSVAALQRALQSGDTESRATRKAAVKVSPIAGLIAVTFCASIALFTSLFHFSQESRPTAASGPVPQQAINEVRKLAFTAKQQQGAQNITGARKTLEQELKILEETGDWPEKGKAHLICLTDLGAVLLAQGHHLEAAKRFEQALAFDPSAIYTHISLGQTQIALSRFEEAEKHLQISRAKFEEAKNTDNYEFARLLINISQAKRGLHRYGPAYADLSMAKRIAEKFADDQFARTIDGMMKDTKKQEADYLRPTKSAK